MLVFSLFFFFNDTATTEIYTLSLHDALPISPVASTPWVLRTPRRPSARSQPCSCWPSSASWASCSRSSSSTSPSPRSEEHTSELQSRQYLVCRLLLEKKKKSKLRLCTLYLSY